MLKRKRTVVCVMLVLLLALTFLPTAGARMGAKFIEEFKALVSRDTIKVGETAVITLSGGQPRLGASTDAPFD